MRHDQADGLRRLIDSSGMRVVSISAGVGSNGRTEAIVNIAGALAELGNDVLILDESLAAHGVTAALGLKVRFDLEDVIRRKRDLGEVIVRGPSGIMVLPMARGARTLAQLPASEQQSLIERCAALDFPVDTLLVGGAPPSTSALFWPGFAAQEVIVLAGGSASAITESYTLIKRLSSEFARREFHVLVSNVASESEARIIFGNMARVARRYLQVSLEFMGHVPLDDKLKHAARLRLPVVAAFPGAVAAGSFRRLAQAITSWPCAEEYGNGFDDFMRRLIHTSRLHTALA